MCVRSAYAFVWCMVVLWVALCFLCFARDRHGFVCVCGHPVMLCVCPYGLCAIVVRLCAAWSYCLCAIVVGVFAHLACGCVACHYDVCALLVRVWLSCCVPR